jgi:hypothetical protein
MKKTLFEKFYDYHNENPHVYKEFEDLSNQAWENGRRRYSGWTIINVIRWNFDITTTGKPFKISNDYIAIYTRLFNLRNPEKVGFFELKQCKRIDENFVNQLALIAELC